MSAPTFIYRMLIFYVRVSPCTKRLVAPSVNTFIYRVSDVRDFYYLLYRCPGSGGLKRYNMIVISDELGGFSRVKLALFEWAMHPHQPTQRNVAQRSVTQLQPNNSSATAVRATCSHYITGAVFFCCNTNPWSLFLTLAIYSFLDPLLLIALHLLLKCRTCGPI